MKVVWYLLALVALALAIFNLVQIDFENPFGDKSTIAIGGTLVSLCAMILIFIYLISKSIKEKIKK
jgi:NADH:ubiquinone oxidoreductase subunit 6 (subunit J)